MPPNLLDVQFFGVAGQNPAAQAVNILPGAQIGLFFYVAHSLPLDIATVTLAGVAMTPLVTTPNVGDAACCGVFSMLSPPVGAQALQFSWSNNPTDAGPSIYFVQCDNIDLANAVRDAQLLAWEGGIGVQSVNLLSETTDLMIGLVSAYAPFGAADITPAGSDQTQLDDNTFNNYQALFGQKNTPLAGNTDFFGDGPYGAIIAVSLTEATEITGELDEVLPVPTLDAVGVIVKNARNISTSQQTIADMFRENKPAQVAGYLGVEGEALGQRGDVDAPWVKEPAFTTDAILIAQRLPVPHIDDVGVDYVALPDVECRQQRLIAFYFDYTTIVANTGQLSIIPEAFINGTWFAWSLINVPATPFVPVGPRFTAGGFASRPVQFAEFRTDVLVAATTARWTMTFDVSSVERVRLNVLDVVTDGNPGNLLAVSYALSN